MKMSQYAIYPEYEVKDEHKIFDTIQTAAERHFVELLVQSN